MACPGGAYEYLSTDNEGTTFIDWMNERGITFAILKYRLPNGHSEVPPEDARRAMEIMRTQGKEFGVNPDEIGVMGSSAGGHLAATLSTMHGSPMYRPDFQILLYPVITMTDKTHKGSRTYLLGENPTADQIERYSLENRVDAQTFYPLLAATAFIGSLEGGTLLSPEFFGGFSYFTPSPSANPIIQVISLKTIKGIDFSFACPLTLDSICYDMVL